MDDSGHEERAEEIDWMALPAATILARVSGCEFIRKIGCMKGRADTKQEVAFQIKPIMASNISRKQQINTSISHPTIFHELLLSDLPPQEKTFDRLR